MRSHAGCCDRPLTAAEVVFGRMGDHAVARDTFATSQREHCAVSFPNLPQQERTVKNFPTTAVILLGALSGTTYAGDMHGAGHHDHAKSQPAAMSDMAMPMTDGVVRAIDHKAGTITVEHGPIKDLGMPAMTMPYHVKDPGMLTTAKPGDKIKMSVDKIGDLYTITTMQRTH